MGSLATKRMKLTRRAFIRLAPIGVAVGVASWWLVTQENPPTSPNAFENANSSQIKTETVEPPNFPVTWNGDFPRNVDSKDYRLIVDGDVANPLQLTLEELEAMPSVEKSWPIRCVEGWSATVLWEGIPLSYLLSQAGAPTEFDHVTVESVAGYLTQINQSVVANSATMIALKAGAVPLTMDHGYPARLVLPGAHGLDWVKQVGRITCAKASGT
jgi:DMSO/TMAO reductase YedYZ molybdopterin-dependent catalytic subunit